MAEAANVLACNENTYIYRETRTCMYKNILTTQFLRSAKSTFLAASYHLVATFTCCRIARLTECFESCNPSATGADDPFNLNNFEMLQILKKLGDRIVAANCEVSECEYWKFAAIGHVNNIPTMQFFTQISRNTKSKAYMLSLSECVWDFQNNALWHTH